MLLVLEVGKERAKALLIRKRGNKSIITGERDLKWDQLHEFFTMNKKDIKEVRLIGAFDEITHKILELPPVKGKLLNNLIKKELRRAFQGAFLFGYEVTGHLKIDNKLKKRVLAVGLDAGTVEEILKTLKTWRLSPTLFTTYPLALREIYKDMGKSGPTAFLHLTEREVRVTFINDSEIQIYRAIQKKDSQNGVESIKRGFLQTLNFYTQEYPAQRPQEIVVLGKNIPDNLVDLIEKESGIKAGYIQEKILREYPQFLGATYISPRSTPFNFLPQEVKERRAALKTTFAVIFLAFALSSYHLVQYFRMTNELRAIKSYQKGLVKMINLKENELAAYTEDIVEFFVKEEQPPWYSVLMEIAAVIPPSLNVVGLRIVREGHNWRAEAVGNAENLGRIESLRDLELLRKRAKRSPLFWEATVSHYWENGTLNFTLNLLIPHKGEMTK